MRNTFSTDKQYTVYFSPEYGIYEGYENYSGGLGILAGDHIKTASDLQYPLFGIGLNYHYGYFKQLILSDGEQFAQYSKLKRTGLPITPLKENRKTKLFSIEMPIGNVIFKTWSLKYKNSFVLLLDTNIQENEDKEVRFITDKLYGGSREKRIMQEYLLGYVGSKIVREMGLNVSSYHINEGHAAFALIEKLEYFVINEGLSFKKAIAKVAENTIFTTHTPVIHGNEVFEDELVLKYFDKHIKNMNITEKDFLNLGKISPKDMDFSMTVLALKLSSYANGVSKLHGETSRKMWRKLWKNTPEKKVPISHITNGIHFPTWAAPIYADFYKSINRKIFTEGSEKDWSSIISYPDNKFEELKSTQKLALINFIHKKYSDNPPNFMQIYEIKESLDNLNKNHIFVGFARRFAPYKRADLLLADPFRLKQMIFKYNIIFFMSGRAHPDDTEGKAMLKNVIQMIQTNHLHRHFIFLENYDMEIGKMLTSSCDIWLNTPMRPKEACGTSGMKASLNGGINISVADGWWAEAFNGKNGFLIDDYKEFDDIGSSYLQADELYNVLGSAVARYYNEKNKWYDMVKESIYTVGTQYSAVRMFYQYAELY